MTARTLMIQGTASNVGKSILVAAFCRIFRQEGLRVAPFKSQNMALNSFVTLQGDEIGRAQAVQAEAAGIEPTVDMNPILLKPESDSKSQVVVLGKPQMTLPARDYYKQKANLLKVVEASLERLRSQYDMIVIEGAGSPAEVNLKANEIVNMRVAKLANSPVLLVGDIDRGGVFASLVGTLDLLDPDERDLVKGLIVNKFRGDPELFRPGVDFLESRTGKPVVGIVPFLKDMRIAQEDSVFLEETAGKRRGNGIVDVAVIHLPHLSNYDDFDPFENEHHVSLRFVSSVNEFGAPDLIIVPGTKTTVNDLQFLRETGLADHIERAAVNGTALIGICGGFQMLGKSIRDPLGVESKHSEVPGLGVLNIETTYQREKITNRTAGSANCNWGLFAGAKGLPVNGYEIHMGTSENRESTSLLELRPLNETEKELHADGAASPDGWICGTYLHGLFHNDALLRTIITNLLKRKGLNIPLDSPTANDQEDPYDALANTVRKSLNMEKIFEFCGLVK